MTSSTKEDSADVDESSALVSAENCTSGVVPPAMKAEDKSLVVLLEVDSVVTISVQDDEFSIPIVTRSNSAIVVNDRAPSFDDERVPLARILQELRETLNSVAKSPGSTERHTLKAISQR